MPLFFVCGYYAVRSSVGIPTTCNDTEQVCTSPPEAVTLGYCGNTKPVNVTPVLNVIINAIVVSGADSVPSHNTLYKLFGVAPTSFKNSMSSVTFESMYLYALPARVSKVNLSVSKLIAEEVICSEYQFPLTLRVN